MSDDIIIRDPNVIHVDVPTIRGIKVNVGSSTQIRSVPLQETNRSIVAPGEQKPTIVPDSVVLGIDTIGHYVETLNVGDGLILSGNNATESANLTISHANTSTEISTSNDIFGVLGNVSIDKFGHVTEFENRQFDTDNFTANSTIISTQDFTFGTTSLTLGESSANIEGLVFVETNILNADYINLSNGISSANNNLIITSDIVTMNGSGALIVPSGDVTERPSLLIEGMIRFNTTDQRFEGYNAIDWTGLGGVSDVNQDTFIRAENPSGSNNDELEFFTNGVRRLLIGSNGDMSFGSLSSNLYLYYNTGQVNVNGFLTVNEIKLQDDQISANNNLQLNAVNDFSITSNGFSSIASDGDFTLLADGEILIYSDVINIESGGPLTFTANGSIILDGDGISASSSTISDVLNPVLPQDAVTLDYLENIFTFEIDVEYGANTKPLTLSSASNPKIFAGTGINADVANNTLNLSINDTGVTPDIYGNDGFVPRIRIGSDGRVTFATEVPIELQANAIVDFTETLYDLVGEMFVGNIEEGIHVFESDALNTINLRVDNFSVDLTGDIEGSATVVRASNTTIETAITVDYLESISAGLGVNVDFTSGIASTAEISHANTSDVANTSNSSGEVVSNLTFDEFGHVINTTTEDLNSLFLGLGGGTLTGDLLAPRFVDSNNTAYYMDPAGASRINSLVLGFNNDFARLEMRDGIATTSVMFSQNGRIGFLGSDFNFASYSERATNNWVVRNDVKASRFVDRNDENYFINPAGTDSILSGLNVENFITVGNDLSFANNTISASTIIFDSNNDIIDAGGSRILNVLTPTQNTNAANKLYVDDAITSTVNNFTGGNGLSYDANTTTFDVNVDGTSIEIVNDILSVIDGPGSNLNADLLDSQHGIYYLNYDNFANTPNILDANNVTDIITSTSIDADLLNGENGSFYLDFNNLTNVPAVDSTEINATLTGKVTGSGVSANNVLTITTELENTGVTSGIYGSASQVPIITIDEDGRITNAESVSVAGVSDATWDSATTNFTIETADGGSFATDISEFGANTSFTNISASGLINGRDVADDGNKLDNIEPNATEDQTAAEILIAIRGVDGPGSDLNADLLDSQHGVYYLDYDNFANTPNILDANNVTDIINNTNIDADLLDGNDSPFYLDYNNFTNTPSSQDQLTANEILDLLVTVDGSGSTLDSDLLDGYEGDYYLDYNNFTNAPPANTSSDTPTDILNKIKQVDGIGSGLDTDLFDGNDSPFYLDYDNFTNTPDILDVNDVTAIIANTSIDADLFDGNDSPFYLDYDNFTNTPDILDVNDVTAIIANTSIDADLLDGFEGSYYTDYADDAAEEVANSISDSTVTISSGSGISGGGSFTLNQSANSTITFAHADTSSVTDVNTSGKSIISEITFDQFGHTLSTSTRVLDFLTTAEADAAFVNVTGDTITGDLEVQGLISQSESAFSSDLSTSATVLDVDLFSFPSAIYSSAEIIITAQQGINKHITKLLIVHDETTAYATEFGTVYTNINLADYDVRLDTGNVIVFATPANGSTINYKIISTLISN